MTFVAKTTTVLSRAGNMPLNKDGVTPKELLPKCVVVRPFKGVALNAVGLSGPGLKRLLDAGVWQKRNQPFMVSYMSVAPTAEERLLETRAFVEILKPRLCEFQAPVAVQRNRSCPNVGMKLAPEGDFVKEAWEDLDILSALDVPIVDKYSVTTAPETVLKIARHPSLDSVCVSNTIPWGQLSQYIDWQRLFATTESPLKQFGGGGLSGWPLLPLTVGWVRKARSMGLDKPIAAGGGILKPDDVDALSQAGASAVCIGSVAMLRPWRVASIIRRGRLFH